MRADDQYFQPGDKVMEAMTDAEVEAVLGGPIDHLPNAPTQPGVVYCVEQFNEWEYGNGVVLVGVGSHLPIEERWIFAAYFRRVSEIKLCVRAAKRLSTTETEEVKV